MLVISGSLILQPVTPARTDLPLIGWRNIITPEGIVADSALENYPASNLANPATHPQAEWRSAEAIEQYLTISTDVVEDVDFIGIAKHNFGSAEIAVSIDEFVDDAWVNLVAEFMPGNDSPLLFRFPSASRAQVRIHLKAGNAAPRAAVVYLGKLLVMERKIYVGHTPLPHGRKVSVANGRSESGNFLGRIVLGEWRESTAPISLMTPEWYRANFDPFLAVSKELPFFFAWRPDTYPDEVGFAWLADDPMPAPVGPSNLIAFEMKMSGVA